MKVGLHSILTRTAPCLAGEVGCERGQALPFTEGVTGSSRRIFPKKKKTLWGTLGNSLAATAPVCSPPCHSPVRGVCTSTGDCAHLISEEAETTGTTQGRVPSDQVCAQRLGSVSSDWGVCPSTGSARTSPWRELRLQAPTMGGCLATRECAHPLRSALTSSQRELRLQAPTVGGCPETRRVPSDQGVCPYTGECPHLISEGAETMGTTQGRVSRPGSVPSDQGVCSSTGECPQLISEGVENAGTTRGKVPSDRECSQQLGSVPSGQGVCSATGE